MTDQTTEIRGARIAFEQYGTGPDVIWGHGLSMTRATEAALRLVDWTKVPARVVRYDARGHGESETTADLDGYTWEALARDQIALADHLGLGTFTTAGASMGCGTAIHTAVIAPDRVSKLVLVIPPTAWETRAAQADLWEGTAQLIENEGPEAVISARAELAPPDPFIGDEQFRADQATSTRSWDPRRLAHAMRGAARADLPPREAIATIDAPTLILAWTGDPVHPMATAEELNGLIAGSRLEVVSTAEELAGWTSLVAEFLDES